MSELAEYKAFKDCHSSLVTCIKQSPNDVCDHLLPFEILAPDDRDYLRNDTHDAGDKARRILDAVLLQMENNPLIFCSFLSALEAAGNFTKAVVQKLNDALQRRNQEQCDQTQRIGYESYPLRLLQPFPGFVMVDETDPESGIPELPSVDDRDTLPDPLEHPPDEAEVGADLRAAATSRQEAPTVDTFEGRLLQTFVSGEIDQVIEILFQAESQSIDLRGVSDADGKTLLHLACRKSGVDWESIVCSLVEKHHCDVAAVDEDGNTPLHEAYQCSNLQLVAYLLTLPTCNPDAINRHDYTVLRMALEVKDKPTTRDLLATGRVDPRKGSPRGHTYQELLAMNQLQPQPRDYDGSALQMVTQFAECMESSNHVLPPFTFYCLRDTLHKILKNRGQVSITGIVGRIKDKMLPLPANPDEIHDLLKDIQNRSNEFDICGEDTNEFGEIKIRRKGYEYENNPERPFPMPPLADTADEPDLVGIPELPTMDERGTVSNPIGDISEEGYPGDLRAAATSPQEDRTVDSFKRRLLQFFRSGEFEQVIEILSQAESQSIDLRGVSDADGKTLLHLACRKNWVDLVRSLIEKHDCEAAAVDEDGNTPLHEAYQCGNLPIVTYLLTLPTCNPDAINKHDYTVLRMALEVNDRKTTRDLLATGRVDPRKGSSHGHTYQELLAMNQLQPQPRDYDGSALQLVTEFAKCMEGSNHVRPPFTSYCLLGTLHKVLKNRDQVTIAGIIHSIQDKMLPLPANPDEIYDLLIDIQSLSDEFDICGEDTNEFGEVQIRKKGERSLPRNVEVPAIEDQETPDYYSIASDELPILQPSRHRASTESLRATQKDDSGDNVDIGLGIFCVIWYCCFVVFLILGICGAVLYNGYSLVGTASVVQIHRQSIPLIAIHDLSTNVVRLTETGTDLVPITFYTFSNCSSFIDVEINEIVTVNFGSPSGKSKAVTEFYLARNTTISLDITTEVISNYSGNPCIAFLLVFDDFSNFSTFISSSSLGDGYFYKGCVENNLSQRMNITFDKPSYYYIGMFTNIPTEATTLDLHFFGTFLQYNISKGNAVCTINSRDALSCDFSLNSDLLFQQICIVGSVPPIDTIVFGIRGAAVEYYTADAVNSDAVIDTFFFIPFILLVSLSVFFVVFLVICTLVILCFL